MRKLWVLWIIVHINVLGSAQNDWQFGLQTGVTASTFRTTVNVQNNIAATIPPLNDFGFITNFHAGCWIEKKINSWATFRWELQRSPGGATTNEMGTNRKRRYKFFALGSPIFLKLAALQRKSVHPIQLEVGIKVNYFLFDYGEALTFGSVQKMEYSTLLGVSKAIDEKWSISLRYLRGMTPFNAYDTGGLAIDWHNRMYVLSFSRSLFSFGKKKDRTNLTYFGK